MSYGKIGFFDLRSMKNLHKNNSRRAAAAGMVIATLIGGLTLFGLLATMCSDRRKRSKAWAPLSL